MRYPAEDIRFKNQPAVVPIPVIQHAPLVSNAYQDDDEEEEEEEESEKNNQPLSIPRE